MWLLDTEGVRVQIVRIEDDAYGAVLHFDDGGFVRWEVALERYELVPAGGV